MRPLLRATRITSKVTRREILLTSVALSAACGEDADLPDTAPTDTGINQEPIAPITDNADFYVTSISTPPDVDSASWTLTVLDRGTVLDVITRATLDAMPARDKEHTLMCIGGGPQNLAIGNAVWTGLPVTEILDALGIQIPEGVLEVKFTAADGYSTSIPVEDLYDQGLHGPLWLVWKMNGEELSPDHGTVARFLTPGRYGQKNPKWPVTIEFIDTAYLGFWESYGWSNDASYFATGLFLDPPRATSVAVGPVTVQGVAYAGKDPVVAVDIRINGGAWTPARLTYSPGADIWVVWTFDYDVVSGEQTLQARSTTASGAMSSENPDGTGNYDGYDGSMEVVIEGV